ncbi:MAG TPA: biotin--[acetyl-CoA-carboxylase] ligase [Chitinophagaceae bacterium]|nr:biotin--[acetyl-CoA-carboxylase] ligase [Chitinophagaceae bacterium]
MPFIELQTVDSTNNYAFSQIHAGLAQHGTAIFAHEQTAGKGQRGKKWVSQGGSAIALSLVIKPVPLALTRQFQLSACIAVSVLEWFKTYAGENVKIKWPNDLYWKDRKAGGILIESIVGSGDPIPIATGSGAVSPKTGTGVWQWAVVGIGININQDSFPPDLPNPVSLRQIAAQQFDTVEMAKELCTVFNSWFERLTHEGFDSIYEKYISSLYKRNKKVKLKKENRVFEAIIKSVSPDGKLIIEHGIEEEIEFGTIEWMLDAGY